MLYFTNAFALLYSMRCSRKMKMCRLISSITLKYKHSLCPNERSTSCHLLFYFTYYALNMFRTLVYPSSGACDCVVKLPHRSSCSQFVVCWSFGCGWFWVVLVLQASACKTSTNQNQPQPKLQHTTNWEQDDRCGNSTTQSQAPEDGYTNVRNMLSA